MYGAQGEWILSGKEVCESTKLFHLYMYSVRCEDSGSSKDPFLTEVSEFAVLFGNELDAEVLDSLSESATCNNCFSLFLMIFFVLLWQVLSMSMDLYVARAMITKASLAFRGSLDITESQVGLNNNKFIYLCLLEKLLNSYTGGIFLCSYQLLKSFM